MFKYLKEKLKNVETKKNDEKENINKKHKILKPILICIISLIIICVLVIFLIFLGIINFNSGDITLSVMNFDSSYVYDKDNNLIGQFWSSDSRTSVDYNSIPKALINAIVCSEDKSFLKNNGTDLLKTVGAIFNKNSNSSTISEQLVRGILNYKGSNISTRLKIISSAIDLNKKLSKEKIFEIYANSTYFGDGNYGIEDASYGYFSKDLKDLNLSESATLAAIIDMPEVYNPFKGDVAKEKLIDKRNNILKSMLNQKLITNDEYNNALNTNLVFKKSDKSTQQESSKAINSYYIDAVFKSVEKDLTTKTKMSKAAADELIYSGGLKIYTSYDPNVQNSINDTYNSYSDTFKKYLKNGKNLESAMVIIDNKTSNVLGLIGSSSINSENTSFNRAINDYLQPGILFSTFTAYGPAFEKEIVTPDSIVEDAPLNIGSWNPQNSNLKFYGNISIKEAFAKSLNIPAIKLMNQVGIDYAFDYAKKFGFSSLDEKSDKALTISIGGLRNGVNILELANAYVTVANNGIYNSPKLYTKVVDSKGNEILSQGSENKQVIGANVVNYLLDCLKFSTLSNINASISSDGVKNIIKEATTDKNTNQWSLVITPTYTLLCWDGYDIPTSIDNTTSPYISSLISTDILTKINNIK